MSTGAATSGGALAWGRRLSAARAPFHLVRLFAWLQREAFPVAVGALYGTALLLLIPGELLQDGWSTLVAGREIDRHGLPHHETLTVMAHGARWIDQQWLAQLTFFELFRAGGYRLILIGHVLLIASAFALALVVARRRGASPLSVFVVGGLCFFVAPWGWQLRAQSFAPLLFVAVLSLLVADERSPSRRVLAVLPLLVLWANLHGSVLLGAALVSLYGLVSLVRGGSRRRGLALFGLAPLTLLCTPYGLSMVPYYRQIVLDSDFSRYVVEWGPPTPAPATALFYLLAFGAVWCIARWGRRLGTFEQLALLVTLAAALSATRNIVWFGLTALVVLPLALDEVCARASGRAHPAARTGFSLAALAALLAAGAFVLSQPAGWYTRAWPDRAAARVASASRDPSVRVFASERYADWLLWRAPELSGRVAFDIRFELESRTQLRLLIDYFSQRGPDWTKAARGYDVIVLDRARHEHVRTSLVSSHGVWQTYVDRNVAVLVPRPHARKAAT